jgi:hypothetical protein
LSQRKHEHGQAITPPDRGCQRSARTRHRLGNAFFDLPSCSFGKHVYLRVAVMRPGTNI